MKRFKSIRSELNENEYSAIVTGNGNRSARTNDTISDVAGAKSLANLNAMLSSISRSTYLDPIEAFNKIRVRLNIALLDIEWNALKNHTGEETFTVPVRRYSRVDGVDAITGEIRMDGRANNPDGSKDLFLRVEVSLNADSLYVVDAQLMTAMDFANVGESTDSEVSEETEQIDEVKKKRMLNLTGLPTDKGTIPSDDTKPLPGGAGAKRTKKHPGTGLPKSGLLRGQRWSGLLGTQMNDPKKVKPKDRYLPKKVTKLKLLKISEETEQIDEVKKKRMLNLTGLPTDKGTIPSDDTKPLPGGAGAKRTKKHPGTGLPKSGLLRGQRWSGLLGTQMNDPKKVKPKDRYLPKKVTKLKLLKISEETEQIDELSPSLLGRYVNKAASDISSKNWSAGRMFGSGQKSNRKLRASMPERLTLLNKGEKRQKGISKAINRLTKRG